MTAVIPQETRHEPNSSPFRVFATPKYCLYFGGQLISQSGTWMQSVATSWLAYRLTGSPFLLAVVGMSSQLPSLVVMPYAGVLIDRFNRHRVVLLTQIVAMLQAFVLAYLALTHQIQVWHLIALGLWAGIVAGFDMPSRSAFVVGLVDRKEDLSAAIAMNATLMNITRLIGPAIAGFLVSSMGEGSCFLLNALSYIAVIGALLFIKGDFEPPQAKHSGVWTEFTSGLKYAWNTAPLRELISMMAVFGLGGMAYALLLPVFVKQIGGNANTLGYLMSASAVGSICGTLLLAHRKEIRGLGRWIARSSFGFSIALFAFSQVHSIVPALMCMVVMGFAMMIQMASTNTMLQALVDDDKRGRVMSLYSMAFMGTAPIGSLVCGSLATHIGFSDTMLICALYCLAVASAWTFLLPKIRIKSRALYEQRGLIAAEEEFPILSR